MRAVNSIHIVGNVGRDPQVRTTQGGKKVASFSVATSEKWQGGERTDWHRVTCWGNLAEIVEKYVGKGDRLYIEGQMRYGSYEKDGATIPTAEINARTVTMLGSNRDRPVSHDTPLSDPADDLPF